MIGKVVKKIFGSRNDRLIKKMRKDVAEINDLEPKIKGLSDEQLQQKTVEFKQRLEKGESLDQILPEAFAVVREASQRVLGMRPYDVQLIGGQVLHQGNIAEMRTGEGKTLTATLPMYLNALPGKGAHLVTVNDYLARRDAEWMGRLYHFLGLTTGVINSSAGQGPDAGSFQFDPDYEGEEGGYLHLRPVSRQEAYACDITYGTNNEYGFDYLRDNMAFSPEQRAQRRFYAIVDEVDSILIDEARTPLIISGPAGESSDIYKMINVIPPQLTQQAPTTDDEGKPDFGPGDYSIDEKSKTVTLSDEGHEKVENILVQLNLLKEGESLYDVANLPLMHYVMASLRAHVLFKRNDEYIVENGEIVIIDDFTGRKMHGRRWSEGLHQAIEAKEGVHINQENQTLASITFQNFFRLYDKLSGMTGTADTEAFEFQQIYGLETIVIPTHRDMVREDQSDLIFLTQQEKFDAIIDDIRDCVKRGQPVLVGTASIEVSEYVSGLLKKAKIKHQVLNAKQHEREAKIVAEAGLPSAVTIATNMAGRGTDIVLGGNLEMEIANAGKKVKQNTIDKLTEKNKENHKKVLAAGGLRIIGTERHESRRIDNQLRGRAGRQGDPGSSRFYLSMEDSLMRMFASERVANLMQKLGMEKGESIEHKWVNKAIENAQRKVEGRNFDIRKQLLEYDDVANDQRKEVYSQRDMLMGEEDISDLIKEMREEVLSNIFGHYIPPQTIEEQWDIEGLEEAIKTHFGLELPVKEWLEKESDLNEDNLRTRILDKMLEAYQIKEEGLGSENMRHFEKAVMLQTLDHHWKEHLAAMDYLRQGIHLRGYAQKNPKQEYKREAFELFSGMIAGMKQDVIMILSQETFVQEPEIPEPETEIEFQHQAFDGFKDEKSEEEEIEKAQPFVREGKKVGRNAPCPCGSGKKYKQCCGKLS